MPNWLRKIDQIIQPFKKLMNYLFEHDATNDSPFTMIKATK